MVKIGTWIIDTDSIIEASNIALRLEKRYNKDKGTVQYKGNKIKWWSNTIEHEKEALNEKI